MRGSTSQLDLPKLVIGLMLLLFVIGADSRRGRRRRNSRDLGKDPDIKGMIKEWEKLERRYSQDHTPRRFRRKRGDLKAFGMGRATTRKVITNVFHDSFDAQLPPWKWALSSESYDRRRVKKKVNNKRLAKHKRSSPRWGKDIRKGGMTFVEKPAPVAPLIVSHPKETPRTPRFLQGFSPYTTLDSSSGGSSESDASDWEDVTLNSSECNNDLDSSARWETPGSVVYSATWAIVSSVIVVFLM